jgi:hypothetical protein
MALLVPAEPTANVVSAAAGLDTIRTLGQFTLTTGVTLTASATPHALPASPTELLSAASNTIEAEWIRVSIHGTASSVVDTNSLLNIYLGAAGSETLFIDSLSSGWAAGVIDHGLPRTYWFPVRIPRGTRISASLRALIASDTAEVIIELGVSNGTHWVGSGVETLGEVTASSRGTAVTPANIGPAWTTIGTTGRRYRHISVGVQGNNDTSILDTWYAWIIGTGSAVYQNLAWMLTRSDNLEAHDNETDAGWWCDIPSGTSLQLRAHSSNTPSGLVYATLHGVY